MSLFFEILFWSFVASTPIILISICLIKVIDFIEKEIEKNEK